MTVLRQEYQRHVDELTVEIDRLRRRGRLFVAGEIATFALFIGCLALLTVVDGRWPLVAAVLALVGYVAVRRADVRCDERRHDEECLRRVYHDELCYLDGDFSVFDDGSRYADARHPFAFDLDLFGAGSLFNRVNRTVTAGGSDRLAWLLADSSLRTRQYVEERRAKIGELAREADWRTCFIATGRAANGQIDTARLLAAIDEVRQLRVPSLFGLRLLRVAAFVVIVLFVAATVAAVVGCVDGNVVVWWAVAQFFAVVLACQGTLRDIGRAMGKLHRELTAYIRLVRHAATLGTRCKLFTGQSAQLAEAVVSFGRLDEILRSIDSRGNLIGLVLTDVFLLRDLFTVMAFARWQRDFVDRARAWIDIVSDIDALVSMATMRYNHGEAVDAEVVEHDGIAYEAFGLYHPFLGAKAVRNDFSIADGHYYIVTGANMAGKSTFLRAVGINYVLAMNGMPVFAERLRLSLFSLFSSMRTTDDLTHGISYFNAELLRLRQLLDYCGQNAHTLIILDEILKGTNSLDKLNGSRLFLEHVARMPVSGVIATHDLALSDMADERPNFHNFCFEIEMAADVTYTYKITPGVARNQNATFLLRRMLGQ